MSRIYLLQKSYSKTLLRCPFCTKTFPSLALCSSHLNSKQCAKFKQTASTPINQQRIDSDMPSQTRVNSHDLEESVKVKQLVNSPKKENGGQTDMRQGRLGVWEPKGKSTKAIQQDYLSGKQVSLQ